MSISANDIVNKIMENAMDRNLESPGRFHVSQREDQLPDFRIRNAFYRAQLERQIAEKKEMERKRKEREMLEEERLLRKIEADRDKLRREYIDEVEKRRILQEDALKRQQQFAKRLEEIHEKEEREKEQAEERRRQQLIIDKRILELKEAAEKKKEEDAIRRKLLYDQYYTGHRVWSYPQNLLDDTTSVGPGPVPKPLSLTTMRSSDYWDWKMPWNSREYVHSALNPESLVIEDVLFEAPLPILADVYKKLDVEKKRIKEIMRQRIIQDVESPDWEENGNQITSFQYR